MNETWRRLGSARTKLWHGVLVSFLATIVFCGGTSLRPLLAADYFLTIGGGYDPSGNQASLEANVVFFQNVLAEKHRGTRRHEIYFADGHDPANDLQVLADKPAKAVLPATDALLSLYRRRDEVDVTYRNHRVQEIAGPLDPKLIRETLLQLAKTAREGDRLIVYVTAHGSEGPKEDQFNTTIDCWDEKTITAREFSQWLNKLPAKVPVVMVMAQCYCGGFAHTIFQDLKADQGLAPQLRAGFFAQQHNLPAAGCRPDIEHDEEFSSYFWGALAGRSRNGIPVKDCDVDQNGVVSFAEAYAHAVIAGETVDIPLRTSEVLLRTYSRLSDTQPRTTNSDAVTKSGGDEQSNKTNTKNDAPAAETNSKPLASSGNPAGPPLSTMTGTLQSVVARSRPVSRRIVVELSKSLGLSLDDDVTTVLTAAADHRRAGNREGRGRGGRQGSGRRNVLKEVTDQWPELGDEEHWEESPLLKPENQQKLLAEIKQLPSWKAYEERLAQREAATKTANIHELRAVKFRRLINTLEAIILEQNLPLVATPEIVSRYQQLLGLEESTLAPSK